MVPKLTSRPMRGVAEASSLAILRRRDAPSRYIRPPLRNRLTRVEGGQRDRPRTPGLALRQLTRNARDKVRVPCTAAFVMFHVKQILTGRVPVRPNTETSPTSPYRASSIPALLRAGFRIGTFLLALQADAEYPGGIG
jgi:hypothetical protein